jgi:hypothetical protein
LFLFFPWFLEQPDTQVMMNAPFKDASNLSNPTRHAWHELTHIRCYLGTTPTLPEHTPDA